MAQADRQHVGTLVLEGLLVVLAFLGIVVFLRLFHTKWLIPAGIAWGVLVLADLFFVIRRAARSRADRPQQTPKHDSAS